MRGQRPTACFVPFTGLPLAARVVYLPATDRIDKADARAAEDRMTKPAKEPRLVRPDDIDPHHRWDRPLQAPGHTQVDFEERVNFRRLHDYRLARTRAALAHSGLGGLLCFDQHNIRYITSTVIGEWARDKLTRYALLTGNGDPYIWDFGSAAKHHRLHAPWLQTDHCRAGLLGMRGEIGRASCRERV